MDMVKLQPNATGITPAVYRTVSALYDQISSLIASLSHSVSKFQTTCKLELELKYTGDQEDGREKKEKKVSCGTWMST